MGFNQTRDLYTTISSASTISETYSVQAMQDGFTLQIVGSPSTVTVQGSNDDGITAAIANWSNLTTIIGAGMFNITPGFRWIRAIRSNVTTANVILDGWSRSW